MTRRPLSFLTSIVPLVSATVSASQSAREVDKIHFDDILTGRNKERRVELHLRAVRRYAEPVAGLTPADFTINDAAGRIDPEDVEVRTLSATGAGMTCVIAIDVSRTMRGDPFERARLAAIEFVHLLDARDRVAIVTFSDQVRVPVAFSASRAEALAQLELLAIYNRSLTTVLYDGLHKSIEMIRLGKNLPRRAFIVAFSDGKDPGSLRNTEHVTEFGRSNSIQPPVLIFSIGYPRFGGDGRPILRKRSKDTVEGISATRTAACAKIRPPILPWIIAGGVFLIVLAIGLVVARGRSKGRLLFVNGSLAVQPVALQRSRTRVGALPDNDVVVTSEMVSRYHATISGGRRKARIQDLYSSNGAFINETRISSSLLELGDRIRFANVEVIFEP